MDTRYLNKLQTFIKKCKCSVFVYAYTRLNVGDDLFLHQLVSMYPDVRFILIAEKTYKEMFCQYRNVTVYEEEGFLLNICKKLRIDDKIRWRISHECDYAVYIGGSIFKEYDDWENQAAWYQQLFDNDRMYFLGCSWGPCRTKQFEDDMASVLSNMKDVCFRDRYSYNTFSHLLNVRYAPDILLNLDLSAYADIEEKKQIFVSVINCRTNNEHLAEYVQEYIEFIGNISEYFEELGYKLILCSFCEKEGDLLAAEEIYNSLSARVQHNTSIVNYCGTNLDHILKLIVESEYVVATRFHAMILGIRAKKKVLPVIYHIKMRNVLNDLSFQGMYCDIKQLPKKPSEIIEGIACGISNHERTHLAALANGHFEEIDKELKKNN